MKLAVAAIAAAASAGIALAACGSGAGGTGASLHSATIRPSATPAPTPTTPSPATPTTPAPTSTAPVPSATPQGGPPSQAPAQPNVTDPWAVVSAYYGDIESGNYAQAWSLINDGATTGQTYQQFADGFACTGAQQLTEVGESGSQVTFDLAATNTCTGQVQYFSGTDTVENGTIVSANVQQTG